MSIRFWFLIFHTKFAWPYSTQSPMRAQRYCTFLRQSRNRIVCAFSSSNKKQNREIHNYNNKRNQTHFTTTNYVRWELCFSLTVRYSRVGANRLGRRHTSLPNTPTVLRFSSAKNIYYLPPPSVQSFSRFSGQHVLGRGAAGPPKKDNNWKQTHYCLFYNKIRTRNTRFDYTLHGLITTIYVVIWLICGAFWKPVMFF